MTFSPPQGRCTRWLLKAGTDVPDEVRNALIQSLYGTLPIYAGGLINNIAVALLIWWRNPQSEFQIWLALEIVCCLVRLCVLVADRRAVAQGAPTSTDLYLWLSVLWADSGGYGTFIHLLRRDLVAAPRETGRGAGRASGGPE